MPENQDHVLAPMVRKLSLREDLSEADRAAILGCRSPAASWKPGNTSSGTATGPEQLPPAVRIRLRHKLAGNGDRQILSFHMHGDIVDLQNSLLGIADHNVQMLTPGEVALIPV